MGYELTPGKLGFKISDVLTGLAQGTLDTPESINSSQGKLHVAHYAWNPDTLAWEVDTTGGAGVGREVTVTNLDPKKVRVDVASGTVTYFGWAAPGTATSSAGWRIAKKDTASGLALDWADGNLAFDNIWDNRAALSYG